VWCTCTCTSSGVSSEGKWGVCDRRERFWVFDFQVLPGNSPNRILWICCTINKVGHSYHHFWIIFLFMPLFPFISNWRPYHILLGSFQNHVYQLCSLFQTRAHEPQVFCVCYLLPLCHFLFPANLTFLHYYMYNLADTHTHEAMSQLPPFMVNTFASWLRKQTTCPFEASDPVQAVAIAHSH